MAQVKCSSKSVLTCGKKCEKELNCTVHKCTQPCHTGECEQCTVLIKLRKFMKLDSGILKSLSSFKFLKSCPQFYSYFLNFIPFHPGCFCTSEQKDFPCTQETISISGYSCGRSCGKPLNCKNHFCTVPCHEGKCRPCILSPEAVLSCPCGQTSVSEACRKAGLPPRISCLDKIPTCGKVCKKLLPCGGEEEKHSCETLCHLTKECPPCPLKSSKKCRCGNKVFQIPCVGFNPREDVLCEKKCAKVNQLKIQKYSFI
jgi:transcriptional repressor NF-X1